MSIDWFTVVAQILNFLILVWLLKRFLYQPILNAIDAREQRIAEELKNADTKQSEAQKERDDFARKNAEFEKQKQVLMLKATQEADIERTRILTLARDEACELEVKLQQAIELEQKNVQAKLRYLASNEVFAITRKVLTDLAGTSIEQSITETFIGRLQAMESDIKQAFISALSENSLSSDNKKQMKVCSAFELQPQQKAAIKTAIDNLFLADIPLQFDTATPLISGIKMSFKGQQISWNIDQYLASLEKSVEELLQAADVKSSTIKSESVEYIPTKSAGAVTTK